MVRGHWRDEGSAHDVRGLRAGACEGGGWGAWGMDGVAALVAPPRDGVVLLVLLLLALVVVVVVVVVEVWLRSRRCMALDFGCLMGNWIG